MFSFLFPTQEAPQAPQETQITVDVTTRRSDVEVQKLVNVFQRTIEDCDQLKSRVTYFWPAKEFSDQLLYSIARDIPKAKNPLLPPQPDEDLLDDDRGTAGDADGTTETASLVATPRSRKEKRRRNRGARGRRKSGSTDEDVRDGEGDEENPYCVEWLGLVNSVNQYAAIKLSMPATYEDWVTWTNRLIAFLFADIPDYTQPEDFVRLLNPPQGGPFLMRCGNPRCVRLSHAGFSVPVSRKSKGLAAPSVGSRPSKLSLLTPSSNFPSNSHHLSFGSTATTAPETARQYDGYSHLDQIPSSRTEGS